MIASDRPDDASLRLLFGLIGVAVAALLPFFPLLLIDRGLTPGEVGIVLAAMSLGRLTAGPVWGHVADAWVGRIRALRAATLASAAAAVIFAMWARGILTALLAATFLSLWWAPVVSLGDALAVTHLGDGRLGEYGRIRQWSSIAYAAAVLGFGAMLEAAPFTVMPVLFACCVAAVGVWSFARQPDRPPHRSHGGLGAVGASFRAAPRLAPFLVGILLVAIGTTAAWQFLPLRIVGRGGGPFLVGIAGALGATTEVPLMRASRALTGKSPLRVLYGAGCLAYVVVFGLWGVVGVAPVIAVLSVLEGLGFALTFTSMVIIVGRLLPGELQATGQGLVQTATGGLAPVLGSLLGGLAYQYRGPATLFVGAAVLVAIGVAIVWLTLSAPAFSVRTVAGDVVPTTEAGT